MHKDEYILASKQSFLICTKHLECVQVFLQRPPPPLPLPNQHKWIELILHTLYSRIKLVKMCLPMLQGRCSDASF